jgi:nucleoid-associated protein YgaU
VIKRHQTTAIFLLIGAVAWLTAWIGPSQSSFATALSHPQRFVDDVGADAAAIAVVAGLIWIALAWLTVGLLLAVAGQLPGFVGHICQVAARRALPGALHRIVAAALGISIATSTGAIGTAFATTASAGAPQPTVFHLSEPRHNDVAHPTIHRTTALVSDETGSAEPTLDWPATPNAPSSAEPSSPTAGMTPGEDPGSGPSAARDMVTVQRGDTLWSIAAAHLGPQATTADVAAEWPRWYQANRSVIGDDPDLILPGQQLTPPASGADSGHTKTHQQ